MNKLKQNIFWVICGVAGAALLAICGVVLFPLFNDKEVARSSVSTLKNSLAKSVQEGMPGNDDVKAWEQRRALLVADYDFISKHYIERDKELQRWFPENDVELPDEPPPRIQQFADKYRDNGKEIENMFKAAGIAIGIQELSTDPNAEPKTQFGFNWEKLSEVPWEEVPPADEAQVVRLLQKRFWIARHLANACAPSVDGKSQKVAERLLDLRFFKELHNNGSWFQPLDAQIAGVRAPLYSGSWARIIPGVKFPEFELPDRLGLTITFGAAVEIRFDKVPAFLQQMLNPSQRPQILINILSSRIFVEKQNPPEVKGEVEVNLDLGQDKDKMVAEWKAKMEKELKPVNATVWLVCQALDFDPAARPKWAGKTQ